MSYIARIQISGIKCGGCYNRIDREIKSEDVITSEIDFSTNIVKITYENNPVLVKRIIEKIERAGYKVKLVNLIKEEE